MNKKELQHIFLSLMYVMKDNENSIPVEYEEMENRLLNDWNIAYNGGKDITKVIKKVYEELEQLENELV